MNQIEKQVREAAEKAWCDIVENKIRETPPDFEYVVKLYEEVRNRFIGVLKKGSPKRLEIEEHMDVKLFRQMICNDVFTRDTFSDLTCYVFQLSISLGSPKRDEKTKEYREDILGDLQSKDTIYEVVPKFFLRINNCLDWIYEDLSKLQENITNEIKLKSK